MSHDAGNDLFAKALTDYFQRIDRGEAVDRDQLLATHPAAADRLAAFLDAEEEVTRRAGALAPDRLGLPTSFPCRIGDYLLLEKIAEGGRGVVYKAQQISLDRTVAVKVSLYGTKALPEDLARFEIGAKAAANLSHPNIVPVYEVGQWDGLAFLSMEYVDGTNLAELARREPLAPERAARYVREIAEAIEHSHRRNTLHRDLKPSNVLIDRSDRVRVLDFDLARRTEDDSDLTQTGEILGTPSYMSPEQALGRRDQLGPASDVYSLGAILYELMTGQPPFREKNRLATMRVVVEKPPLAPRQLRRSLPKTLETICLHCLEKRPSQRYASAQELADDLGRFLRNEPILARPTGPWERMGRWAAREPGWAAALAAVVATLVAVAVGSMLVINARRESAESRRAAAEDRLTLQQIQQLRLVDRHAGWSGKAWKLIEDAVARRGSATGDDRELQTQAAACLDGLDATLSKRFDDFGALHLAYDDRRSRLLLGGVVLHNGSPSEARLWDRKTDRLEKLALAGTGPVGFYPNGTPWQLAAGREDIRLIDLTSGAMLRRFVLPEDVASPATGLAASRDGALVTAASGAATGQRVRLLWDGATGDLLHRLNAPTSGTLAESAGRRVAFSPDGSLLAEADDAGRIVIWSVVSGKRLSELTNGRMRVHCVAFAEDSRVVETNGDNGPERNELAGWLLAAGDASGATTIWNLMQQTPRTGSLRSRYDVFSVAFSPDATLLASAGRHVTHVWDVATGRKVLSLGESDFATDLVFSSDGHNLFVGRRAGFAPASVVSWNLEFGRGMHTLRGLAGRISKLRFSSDGKMIAALSHDWQVGVWDADGRRLLRVIDVPPGVTADNAALAFSPDGSQLAFSAGENAFLWNSATGRQLRQWQLPKGLVEAMAFPAPERLLLFRVETQDGRVGPYSDAAYQQHPRVCRVRDLLAGEPLKPFAVWTDFNRHVMNAQCTSDGRFIVVDGIAGPDGSSRLVKLFNVDRGAVKTLLNQRNPTTKYSVISIDPAGETFTVFPVPTHKGDRAALYELPQGKLTRYLAMPSACLAPRAEHYASWGENSREAGPASDLGLCLLNVDEPAPLVRLVIDSSSPEEAVFSSDGRLLAWGTDDGRVLLAELAEMRKRLSRAALGW